jgi:hypothetical protein
VEKDLLVVLPGEERVSAMYNRSVFRVYENGRVEE